MGYGKRTTAAQVAQGVDLKGKVAIVTGAASGIGKETARVLATCFCHVILACRDMKACGAVVQEIRDSTGNSNVEGMTLDLASLESIRSFVTEFEKKGLPLNLLINNAGVMACPKLKTADGFEMQLGTNHLGHFLLTNLLLPSLKKGAPSRVVTVSSMIHTRAKGMNWDDLMSEKSYGPWAAYAQSKLANVLFTTALNKRLQGTGVTCYALHPGVIATKLQRHMTLGSIFSILAYPFIKSIPQGAATSVYCAVSPDAPTHSGRYFDSWAPAAASKYGVDPDAAERLWDVSAKLVGLAPPQ